MTTQFLVLEEVMNNESFPTLCNTIMFPQTFVISPLICPFFQTNETQPTQCTLDLTSSRYLFTRVALQILPHYAFSVLRQKDQDPHSIQDVHKSSIYTVAW